MSIDEFEQVCRETEPPGSLPEPLLALYWDSRGDWNRAHKVTQEISTSTGSLIHAYLHRKEGDHANARYWYDRAGQAAPKGTLEQEWRAIATELCGQTGDEHGSSGGRK